MKLVLVSVDNLCFCDSFASEGPPSHYYTEPAKEILQYRNSNKLHCCLISRPASCHTSEKVSNSNCSPEIRVQSFLLSKLFPTEMNVTAVVFRECVNAIGVSSLAQQVIQGCSTSTFQMQDPLAISLTFKSTRRLFTRLT